MKIYIIKFSSDCAYLEEFYYTEHEERYQKTKGIPVERIFEESEIDRAIAKLVDLNY